MSARLSPITAAAIILAAVFFSLGGSSFAVIGGQGSKHNFGDVAGYGFPGNICAPCHSAHFSSGKVLWAGDKEQPGDASRDLAHAKASSRDQAAGGYDYPGIYLCLDCHDGSTDSPSWATAAGHAAPRVVTHSSLEMQAAGHTPKHGSFVVKCTACHDAHSDWDGSFKPGENGYMIMPVIQTPNSGPRQVVFLGMTGAGSMGPGARPTKAVCEVCHTLTTYHNNSTSLAHNSGADCTLCHKHAEGFAGAACNSCHGTPPTSYATLVGRPANPGSTPTGAPGPGMHAFHAMSTAGGAGYQCKACHRRGMGDGKGADKVLDVRFEGFGVTTSGSFDGFAPISGYTFSRGNTTGGTLKCANTYCHGNFIGGNALNRPAWNDASTGACGTCHDTAPPGLLNHSVHLSAEWGPKAACEDCHPTGSSTGRHTGHVDGVVGFKDGKALADTTVCNRCHGCSASTKPTWGNSANRASTSWCISCHKKSSPSVISSQATAFKPMTAPDVMGDGLQYGFDVTGHGRPGISAGCASCHGYRSVHMDGLSPTYTAARGNYGSGYRLMSSNTVPLLGNYSSGKFALCYKCHSESRVVGMPAEGRRSSFHMHTTAIRTSAWYTDFRNMSTTVPRDQAGNYDPVLVNGAVDIPTNIHWNHLDAFGSNGMRVVIGKYVFDSDRDGTGDSNITCTTCHNVHGTRQPAMMYDDFALQTFSALANQSLNTSYRWLGSEQYNTTRCTSSCHTMGDAGATAGTKWYRQPAAAGSGSGAPQGLQVIPLP